MYALRELAPLGIEVGNGLQAAASGLRHILHVASMIPGSGITDPDGGYSSYGSDAMTEKLTRGGRGSGGKGAEGDLAKAIGKLGGGGGGGGTNIGSVVIRVEGAGDPSRIAKLVLGHLENLRRNPKSSRNVPNVADVHMEPDEGKIR